MSDFFTPRKKVQDTGKNQKPLAKRRLFTEDEDVTSGLSTVVSPVAYSRSTSILDTPQKKRRRLKEKAVVTPDKDEVVIVQLPKEGKEEEYVPTYIHRNLSYQREGEANIDDNTKSTFNLIKLHFDIPQDFETNRRYGPISGNCHELRAIAAYNFSLLEPKKKADAGIQICSECAAIGHKRTDCPSLI
jgi:hypothetical protein